jgi:hypothetical protein
MEEIRNKVAESGLINLDLASFKPDSNSIVGLDISVQLWEGLVLKEKDFRDYIKNEDWRKYANKNVYVHCSADAIIPTWAYMLITSKLENTANYFLVGSKIDLEKELIRTNISLFDPSLEEYKIGRYIIKGCSDIAAPAFAMTELMKKIQPSALSIMYGEPCSTVPIYKKAKVI